MGNLKRRIKQFSKPQNSEILKIQVVEKGVVRVRQTCSNRVKSRKIGIDSCMVTWLNGSVISKYGLEVSVWLEKGLHLRRHIWMRYPENFYLRLGVSFQRYKYSSKWLSGEILPGTRLVILNTNFSYDIQRVKFDILEVEKRMWLYKLEKIISDIRYETISIQVINMGLKKRLG
jgi:hypothetical protein